MTKLEIGSAVDFERCDNALPKESNRHGVASFGVTSPRACTTVERNPGRVVARARLVRALRTMAMIVSEPGGEVYAPIFERLERELDDLDRRQSVVARAKALAKAN